MPNLELIPEPEPRTVALKSLISLFLLIIGSIVVSIGSFLAFGLAIGLIIVGVLLGIVSVLLGWN